MDVCALVGWYLLNRRDLPWRHEPTPYGVWVSEIMLQQTQVRTVVPYYDRFMVRFPDVHSLAAAQESEVLRLWAGLGYYGRARNLHRAALKIVNEHDGGFPDTLEEVMDLPGIGRYTAGAILSIAFNQAHPAVDGNVRRVIGRLLGIQSHRTERFYRQQALAWIPQEQPSDFNQALMELGALVCVPALPRCDVCPLRLSCATNGRGIQGRARSAARKRRIETVELVVLILLRGDDVLVCRQSPRSFIPGEWGLPTRELTDGQDPNEVARQLAHEIISGPAIPVSRGHLTHAIVRRRIHAHVHLIKCTRGTVKRNCRWVPGATMADYLTSSLFHKAIDSVF